MSHGDGGKGDAPRKQQDQKAYDDGWDRIFGRKKQTEDGEILGKAIIEDLKEPEECD